MKKFRWVLFVFTAAFFFSALSSKVYISVICLALAALLIIPVKPFGNLIKQKIDQKTGAETRRIISIVLAAVLFISGFIPLNQAGKRMKENQEREPRNSVTTTSTSAVETTTTTVTTKETTTTTKETTTTTVTSTTTTIPVPETTTVVPTEPPTEAPTEAPTDPPAPVQEEVPAEQPVETQTVHFVLNLDTNCLHCNPNCRAALKILPENYSTIDIAEDQLANYAGQYWACGICSKRYSSQLPKF